jgi:hypothetical protein
MPFFFSESIKREKTARETCRDKERCKRKRKETKRDQENNWDTTLFIQVEVHRRFEGT